MPRTNVLDFAAEAIEAENKENMMIAAERLAVLAKTNPDFISPLLIVAARLEKEQFYPAALSAFYRAACYASPEGSLKENAVQRWAACLGIADDTSAQRSVVFASFHPQLSYPVKGIIEAYRKDKGLDISTSQGKERWQNLCKKVKATKKGLEAVSARILQTDGANGLKKWIMLVSAAETTNPRLPLAHIFELALQAHTKAMEIGQATAFETTTMRFLGDYLSATAETNPELAVYYASRPEFNEIYGVEAAKKMRETLGYSLPRKSSLNKMQKFITTFGVHNG